MVDTDLGTRLGRYRDRFPGPQLALVLASIGAGNTGGQLWELPREDGEPLLVLLDQGNNVFCLAGAVDDEPALRSLADLMIREVLPRARAEGIGWFKVRALSPSLEAHLPRLFPDTRLDTAPYLFFEHDPTADPPMPPPAGVRLLAATRETLHSGAHAGSEQVREEIRFMWPSEDQFYAHGFGALAILDEEGAAEDVLCWCTAEYVGPTHCGIGIETRPDMQRRGIATATTNAFLQEARRRHLIACWECAAANIPSMRVAEKTGFVLRERVNYRVGFLPDDSPSA